jgi:predicted ArsR family transcriptional regulator
MQTTRERIITYLKKYQTASAGELGRALNFTAANIRHHLKILVEEGKIKREEEKGSRTVGRPSDRYTLTSRTRGENTSGLLIAVLESWQRSPDKAPQAIRCAAQALAGELPDESLTPIGSLNQAVQRLNDLHYQASWEAHPTGPRILIKHCPYLDLGEDYPELCALDEGLLSELCRQPMELVEKRQPHRKIPRRCIFRPVPERRG